jgi:urea carboxylase
VTLEITVLKPGTMTTIQDWPGRLGYWHVGVPPSGPMDDRSFRLGNLALGNDAGAPGLECLLVGPTLQFSHAAVLCVTGAPAPLSLDELPLAMWEPVTVPAGATLALGRITGPGLRTYVLFSGGLAADAYLGSRSTFTLGRFGGHQGRPLKRHDVLSTQVPATGLVTGPVPLPERPTLGGDWGIEVLEGPHAAPEFFTRGDISAFYATDWEVHFNSARTGVRLIGPRPQWAREDGGDAGLHPSNIHDTPYAVGAVDFTGDTPILLGPDGPSLGGFVCPATVATDERWKLGQLRPGDRVRFTPRGGLIDDGILGSIEARDGAPAVTYRRSGDDNLLIEYGPMELDFAHRMRVHVLAEAVAAESPAGLIDMTPGIRSLQVHVDPLALPVSRVLELVRALEATLPPSRDLAVPSRTVELPLSWDDPATRLATERYMSGVRADAPWCPWNIEFIRRINGLDSVEDVRQTVFDASYLVLGLGDVYLGAPVATPLDPRHRLVTTKYNPARTWTPENAVGIGGAYLCIYGMEGPGGYQFVGRTVQVWNREPNTREPWLLNFFDRISWYPVSAEELLELREQPFAPRISEGTFVLAEYEQGLAAEAEDIGRFRERQQAAFGAERQAWAESGEFERQS